MLTVRNEYDNTELIIEKKNIEHLIDNSRLSFLLHTISEELIPDINYNFMDILNRTGYVSKYIKYDWNVFINFLQGKTLFHQSSIIDKYDESIDILTEYIASVTLIDKMRIDIINNNIPEIIKYMGLSKRYEQLIFYEYIYKSVTSSYTTKAIIMIENNYTELMSLLEDYCLEMCTTTIKPTLLEDIIYLVNEYHWSKNQFDLLKRFIDFHAHWLDLNITSDNLISDVSLQIIDIVNMYNANNTNTANNMNNTDNADNEINNAITKIMKKHIALHNLCHLDKLYRDNNKPIIIKLLDKLLPIIDYLNISKYCTDNNQIFLYQSLNLIVRLMEEDSHILTKITKNAQRKILILWMKMSSPTYKCFNNYRTYPYQHFDDPINNSSNRNLLNDISYRIRNIIFSKTINELLTESHITFSEMGYILSKDRLDIFIVMCDHLNFKTIHNEIYKYLPPKIIEYVINKSMKANNEMKLMPPIKININIYNLIDRTTQDIEFVFDLFASVFDKDIIIEYDSIVDRYKYIPCIYIVMYWEYLNLITKFPLLFKNLMILINCIKNYDVLINADIDMFILKIVLDNAIKYEKYIQSMEAYMEHIESQSDFFTLGPDFEEIKNELKQYCVKNLKYIDDVNIIKNNISQNQDEDKNQDLEQNQQIKYEKSHSDIENENENDNESINDESNNEESNNEESDNEKLDNDESDNDAYINDESG